MAKKKNQNRTSQLLKGKKSNKQLRGKYEGIIIGNVSVTNDNITEELAKKIEAKDPNKNWFLPPKQKADD